MFSSRSIIVCHLIAVACLWTAWEYRNASAKSPGNFALMAGPDVIVGDIPSIYRWGSDPDETSFSIGTTSCNIGTSRLNWIQNSTIHPVISQNLYRVKNGRIEQLGMSWLKHGFSVLPQSACNSCTDPGSAWLGVGCSDPYGSQLNGGQSGLGPRSQVNATTGVFSWPKGTLPGNGVLDGRIRVFTADLTPSLNSGAKYFVESMYVHPEDASSGNGGNNASYREAFVEAEGTTGWDIEVGAPLTVRQQPAINAWKAVHPDVQLFVVDVPGDGRIVVGMRTTPLPGNTGYHTEFAVENLSSHQSVRSLGVNYGSPTISNPGFRDVDYQFEAYSGTNWTPNIAANKIEWSIQSFTENANANALRWNSLYSFWCDSELPPRKLTLGMFRPGVVAEMNIDLIQAEAPTAFKLTEGVVLGGQFSNVNASDNQYFKLGPNKKSRNQTVELNFSGTCSTNAPIDFALRLEAKMSGAKLGDIRQAIELFNRNKQQYEEIDDRDAVMSDQPMESTPSGDWGRFIDPNTNAVSGRIVWKNVAGFSRDPFGWSIDIDQAVWLVEQ